MADEADETEFPPEIESRIHDEETRTFVRKLFARRREVGMPTDDQIRPYRRREEGDPREEGVLCRPPAAATDEQILRALDDRDRSAQLAEELQAILELDRSTPADLRHRWRELRKWGMRSFPRSSPESGGIVSLQDAVMARRMYPDANSHQSPEVVWVSEFKPATEELWPQVRSEAADLETGPLHRLVVDLEAVLDGQVLGLDEQLEAVELLMREVELREKHGADTDVDEAAAEEGTTPDVEETAAQEELYRLHADSAWGRAMLQFLYRQPGLTASTSDVTQAGIDAAATDESLRKRTVQETLRVLRATCIRAGGCPPCSDHLGLIDYPASTSRGTLMLTGKGVVVVEAQLNGER